MSERATLRGSRLGGTSFEDESGIEFAPRQRGQYDCPNGHEFEIPMAEEAEVPFIWERPRCGAESRQRDGSAPDVKAEKPARTHWDMLLSVGPSPSSRTSCRSGSSCCATATSAQHTCTAAAAARASAEA